MTTLNLGCGHEPLEGAVNHERADIGPHVDIAWDLNEYLWPWANDEFDHIRAYDVLEHIDDFLRAMDECWRILTPDGSMQIRVPRWDSINVHIDPTHRRGFHPANFDYLDPDTERGRRRSYYTEHKWRIVELDPAADRGHNITVTLEPRP